MLKVIRMLTMKNAGRLLPVHCSAMLFHSPVRKFFKVQALALVPEGFWGSSSLQSCIFGASNGVSSQRTQHGGHQAHQASAHSCEHSMSAVGFCACVKAVASMQSVTPVGALSHFLTLCFAHFLNTLCARILKGASLYSESQSDRTKELQAEASQSHEPSREDTRTGGLYISFDASVARP